MPSGLRETSKPQFEIYYEQPWGGVASDKSAVDIGAGDLVACDGVTVRNGVLCFTDITAQNSLYELNTLNPPNIPPFAPNNTGAFESVDIVSILPADYDYRTGIYNGRLYTVENTDALYVGAVVGVQGTTNSVGDYDFNSPDIVDAVIDSTHFHTSSPYLSAYDLSTYPTPTVTGGSFTIFVANNISSGFGFIPLKGGGYLAIGAGSVPYNTAIPVPADFTYTNSAFWSAPKGAAVPGGNPLISGVFSSTVSSLGVATSSFNLAGPNTSNLQPDSNYVAIYWSAGSNVTTTVTGGVTYVYFTTADGDSLCFLVGQNQLNAAALILPTGTFSWADSIQLVGACTSDGSNHTFQAMGQCQVSNTGVVQLQYRDNQSNFWYGGANVLMLFYTPSSTLTIETLANATGVVFQTSGGQQLCLFAGNMAHGSATSIPAGFDVTTLSSAAAQYGDYSTHGDAEAVCWTAAVLNGLIADSTINSYNDSWNEGIAFFGVVGTLLTPTPPVPPTGGWASSANLALIFNAANFLCGVDQYGFAYIATQRTDGTVAWNIDQIADNGPSFSFGTPTAVKVIDGVAYISVYDTNTLYEYTPQVSYVTATNYVSGKYIEIFDEYLLQLNTNSLNKDSSDGIQPTRINWSSPDQFSQWDAAVNRTAGFQSITSAEDYITGFVAVDNVGYIFRRTGVTQITATGVAIQPFNFTTYWNSVIGQGLLFPGTLKQFGRFIFLVTDSAAYMFYGGSFTAISEKAAAAIFSTLEGQAEVNGNTVANIAGAISIYPINDNVPDLHYMLISSKSITDSEVVFWFYNSSEKCWTSVTKNLLGVIGDYTGTEVTTVIVNFVRTFNVYMNYAVSDYYNNTPNYAVNLTLMNVTYTDDTGVYTRSLVLYDLVSSPTSTTTYTPATGGNLNLLFRQEEVKLGRQPTIRRVVVKACGSGTLQVNVSGVPFGTITLDGTNTPKTYKTKYGIYTGEDPQTQITSSNFYGQIIKVMTPGTYADGDID